MKIMPFMIFVLAMTGTPGPGNLTMMAIGQTTGFFSALPFLAGTAVGFLALNASVALGVGELITSSPAAGIVLKFAGSAYILWLAVKIMGMQLSPSSATHRDFTFYEGLFLHPSSPKSWAMSVVGFTQFATTDGSPAVRLILFMGIFFAGQVSCHSLWCAAGTTLMRFLKNHALRMGGNAVAVLLMLVATGYALFI